MDSIANVLRSGHFGPALIQRQFEWTRDEAHKLLDNIERAHHRATAPGDLETSLEASEDSSADDAAESEGHTAGEPADETEADSCGDGTPATDFDIDITEADVLATSAFATRAPPLEDVFIGTIILRRVAVNRHEIYDGLQRFTTITILLAVLRDQIDDEVLRRNLDQHINTSSGCRLALYGRDRTLAEHIQKPAATLRTTRANAYYDVGRRILYVKNALRTRIEGWDAAKRESFARYLLGYVWVSVLTVADQRMAQEMFVTTNLYGKPLDVIDVLKGQLVDLISQSESEPEPELERFTTYWTALRQEAGNRFAETLRAFDVIERREIQTEAWPTDLGLHVATHYSATRIKHFQNRMWAYMKAWKACQRILARPGRSSLERDLWRLHVFRWPEWHPLALKWWLDVYFGRKTQAVWKEKERALQSRFSRLHRRCMAITLAGFSETDRQKIFRNALDQDAQGRDVFTGALQLTPNQRRKIDRTLRGQIHDREIWAPLTRWLEMSEWRDGLPSLIAQANTEHVRPRSVKWEEGQTPADGMQAYNEGCYSLGNLALIGKDANADMLNDSFAAKLPLLDEEAKRFWMVRSVVIDAAGQPRNQWTNDIILERAEMLRLRVWNELGLKPPQ